ncbi:protein OSCP1a isoform X1 [Takifugu flavidus]|uniref:protein OSCP1a isoform X1 n=2 Tax=Takifugu flavidus TaxID=433684 RepID=UPI0025446472|nr:protein OSCP1a isoform X1 [Takifugu flavidus]
MSMRTLPLVFINLGGEMLYILDQRLRAHNTSEDKSDKGVWSESDRIRGIPAVAEQIIASPVLPVSASSLHHSPASKPVWRLQCEFMNDIIRTMFSKAFMDELLKPQRLYSHRTLKTVLTRVAHTSIMRLSPASMDRLYELMVMAFKYQVFLCPRPKDLLLISYNHIDAVRELAKDTPAVVNHVDETHRRIMEVYSSLSEGEFQLLRQTLLIFFQDMNVRVSIFLKSQVQNPSGRFAMSTSGPVPHGIDVPGLIRLFNRTGREVRRSEFPTGGSYTSPIREGSLDLRGDRVIKLGTNMFTETHPEETKTSRAPSAKVRQLDETPNPLAKEELNLLARLMGSVKAENVPRTETGFRINLFPTEPEDEAAGAAGETEGSMFEVINIQAVQDERAAAELAWIAGQFTDEEEHPENSSSSKGEDLLAMMDELRPTAEPNHQNQT